MQYSRMWATAAGILAICATAASSDAQPLQADPRPTGAQHGSWSQGPGIHTFRICPSVAGVRPYDIRDRYEQEGGSSGGGRAPFCNVTGLPGQSIPITIETWGAGGGGGAGGLTGKPTNFGGRGGGGGGGGGYGRTVLNVLVPATGAVVYFVGVGTGGAGGQTSGLASSNGAAGGFTEVRINNANGALMLKGSGGMGGNGGSNAYGNTGASPGNGTINGWPGTQGYNGGMPSSCNGAAGGLGGAGGGPGRTGEVPYVNDGGNGGVGGYRYKVGCTAHGPDWGRAPGVTGGNGKATFTW